MSLNAVDPAEPLHGNYTASFNSVLKDFPTDIPDISDGQWKASKCRIHDPVVHSLSSGTGCQRKKPGTLLPISALYAARPNAYCHCDEGTRMRDAKMARMMLNCAADDGEMHVGVGVKHFQDANSVAHGVDEFGAGFCYMEGIVATQRVRVAHVLGGKEPLVTDALRAVVVAGRTAMRAVKVEEVRPGFYHVSHDKAVKGMLSDGGLRFAARLYEIAIATGGTARVGSSLVAEMSAEKVAAWAAERGVVIPNEAMRDLSLSTCALGAVPATFVGGRSRSRLLSLVGDRFLKLVLSAHVVDDGGEIGTVQDREAATQSNEVLKDCLLSSGLVKYITVPAGAMLSAKVGGSILEAMVGVVFHHAGFESALRFALAVGVKGLD